MEMNQIPSDVLGLLGLEVIEYTPDLLDFCGVDAIVRVIETGEVYTAQCRERTQTRNDPSVRWTYDGRERHYKARNVALFIYWWPDRCAIYWSEFYNHTKPFAIHPNKEDNNTAGYYKEKELEPYLFRRAKR